MPSNNAGKTKAHKNEEKTVKCPVEGCDAEVLARGVHLHVMRSSNGGHGDANEVPKDVDFDNLEEVGTKEVTMDYPEERESEQVARLCPYCERPFKGKNGVMIHLGQMAGRKDHPKNPTEIHDPTDFPIVHLDENENIVEVVEEPTSMPSTERRLSGEGEGLEKGKVKSYIKSLREQGLDDEADRAEKMLL